MTIRSWTTIGAGLAFFALSGAALAATEITLLRSDVAAMDAKAKSIQASRKPGTSARIWHSLILPLQAGSALSEPRVAKSKFGTAFRYTQTYLGVPIRGHAIGIIETPTGDLKALSGSLFTDLDRDLTSVTPAVQDDFAASLARRIASAEIEEPMQIIEEKRRLAIYIDRASKAWLVYECTVFGADSRGSKFAERTVLVDAITGAVIDSWNSRMTQDLLRPHDRIAAYAIHSAIRSSASSNTSASFRPLLAGA